MSLALWTWWVYAHLWLLEWPGILWAQTMESILGTFLRLGAIWFLDKVQWKWTCCYGEGHGLHPLIGKVIDWRAACCRPEKRKALSHWLLFLKCLVDSEGPKLMLQKDTSCLATTALIRKSNRVLKYQWAADTGVSSLAVEKESITVGRNLLQGASLLWSPGLRSCVAW